ncbi:phosphoribosylamine--glycine ligase [Phormidium sp. LEGE 05292]|uniref:phosphoribosylamine--glycine ligase n=1 Tax=[Phormidium] sp. LEGE 05292 TaxID=767427 RepID=UPI001882102A|nr:phosphoribosylamine--glycine ligase [Phormidium sp. LEGE 05292]MBE9227727.1 phosphoribosylamine--glycine ligase [Phormidium sp. LEGE 05292]
MKILVVGNGGREHALAWKLLQSPQVEQVFVAPGNGGTAIMEKCQNVPLAVDDFAGIGSFAQKNNISLVVVGPEVPLALGITDALQSQNIPVFGPSKVGAQIEASKAWAKALMEEAGIPTAKSATFTDAETAKAYVTQQGAPIVVKADGLAAGKGVIVAQTLEEAQTAITTIFKEGIGKSITQSPVPNPQSPVTVVIEECLIGEEASVLALTDGVTIRPLIPAQDHKRIGEGDTGPNTGGMGAYAPAPLVTPSLMERIEREVLERAIATLQKRQIDYRGVLYAGLMISPQGELKVLEFNCRFGDPETQAVLPMLETPLEELMLACVEQRLAEMPPISWKSGACVCVVMSSSGYPGDYPKGKEITGISSAESTGAVVFHAGTKFDQTLVTDGGRVLGVTAIGDNISSAKALAYKAVDRIQFAGAYYRRDISNKAIP